MTWETIWTFDTRRFSVELAFAPEDTDPSDSFELQEDIDAVRNESVLWFQARVTVSSNGHVIGSDYLGACAYASAEDFYTSHRDPDPMNRNCSIMRESWCESCCGIGETFSCVTCKSCKGVGTRHNVSICHYFPSMISEAIADARATLAAAEAPALPASAIPAPQPESTEVWL